MSSEICMFYLRGACRFGNKCWNSHDLSPYRSSNSQALATAATAVYYEESYPQTFPSTSASGISTPKVQAQGLQLLIEASMKPKLIKPDESEIEMEEVANELSVAMKTGNGKNVKESASKLHALHQRKLKERSHPEWSEVIQSAIDSDLQCNICFEIFIRPTVLNCSHTFCESCIHVWIKRVRKCPICRVCIRSKSFCLTLDKFIEKIVEHFPTEFKNKREIAIKDRSKIKLDKPPTNSILNGRDITAFLNLENLIEADTSDDTPLQYMMDTHDDISADAIVEESEMFRMNLHDTVVSTRGINPLMSYIVSDEQSSNEPITLPNNSSVDH
ncbi:E3 ubiquitin-protein ligase RNF8-like [Melanaphis sacchari]|uniref:E3 ubiquitin-protein ligase RNF8 n=1 Tax=Melanaphis sacchari TaxID=742174 RepID=A0A2H8TYX1_9HEMI|nr:E3 ubiquitin-protein ligase RNF8-like [Melanaphis sacchari]